MNRVVTRSRKEQGGFALLMVFVMAAIIAITLYMEMPRVAFESQRAREQLLVDRGNEYKRAIQIYYRKLKRFPARIEDLESTNNIRFLRQRYKDPMTGKDNWRIVHVGPGGYLTDSLVQKPNPLGGKDAQGQNAQNQLPGSAPGAPLTAQPPQGTALNANGTEGGGINMATARRPSDQMTVGAAGGPGGPPAPVDPNAPPGQAAAYPLPGQPGYFVQPLNPGQVNPGQPPPGQVNPVQGYPGQLIPGQPAIIQPGASPVPGQPPFPGQPGFFQPGATPQPGQPQYQPGQFVTPAQPLPLPPGYPVTQQVPQPGYPNAPQPFPQPAAPGGAPPGLTVGGQNAAINAIQQSLFSPRQQPTGLTGVPDSSLSGGGVAIAGVASTYKGEGIKRVNEKSKYQEWEFVYDMKQDKTVVGNAAGQQQQLQNQQQLPGGLSPVPATPIPTPTPKP